MKVDNLLFSFREENVPVRLKVTVDQEFGDETILITERAISRKKRGTDFPVKLEFTAEKAVSGVIALRIPFWTNNVVTVNTELDFQIVDNYVKIFVENIMEVEATVFFQKQLTTYPLADNPNKVAFLGGPILLAGLVTEEREIIVENESLEKLLIPHAERVWGDFQNEFQLTKQSVNFIFKPVKEIGKEKYTVYFPIKNIN